MPKVIAVNLGNFGSTGTIAREIGECAIANKIDYYFCYPGHELNKDKNVNEILISTNFIRKLNQKLSYWTGYNGCFALQSTFKFISFLKKNKPDIIHFHNIHNSYLNFYLLAKYCIKSKTKIVWTFHDCWPFTGLCTYFDMANCYRWKKECHNCPCLNRYPSSLVDRTKFLFNKKHIFNDMNLTIVTPSKWMANNVKQSFLAGNNVFVINNGVNTEIFKPQESNLRETLHCENKIVLLGVAFDWDKRKGLDIFIELSKVLDTKYQIILIGISSEISMIIPKNIICVERTKNQNELAQYYSMADVLVNPTREDNYPTVNMEAISCGLPVISFDTGGSGEIFDESTGILIKKDDFVGLINAITSFKGKTYYFDNCIKLSKKYKKEDKYAEYVDLYKKLLKAEEKII